MDTITEVAYIKKLNRLTRQIETTEEILRIRPSTQGKLLLVQMILRDLNAHLKLIQMDSLSRLLVIFQAALIGQKTKDSQTGMIGPALERLLKGFSYLVQASLNQSEKDKTKFLEILTQLIVMGVILITQQLRENGKSVIPQPNSREKEKATSLLIDLGLNFLLGTNAIKSAFASVAKGLELHPISQKRVTDIGLFFVYSVLIFMRENHEEDPTLVDLILVTLESMENAISQAQFEKLLSEDQAALLLVQLKLLKSAHNSSMMNQIFEDTFTIFGVDKQELKNDLIKLKTFCDQLSKSFLNIFNKPDMTNVTIIQAA